MSETQYDTKKESKCKPQPGNLYTVSPKAKFKPQHTGFCGYCFALVQLNADMRCMKCKARVHQKKRTMITIRKRFDDIIEHNAYLLESWMPYDELSTQPYMKVNIGMFTLFVPFRYFQEYQNLDLADDPHKYEEFFNHIKKNSPRIAF